MKKDIRDKEKGKREKKKVNSQNKGFTLIELLVVISIISLLSSIVLSSVQDARNKAKVITFIQEIRQFELALNLYKEDNEGDFPSFDAWATVENSGSNDYVDMSAYITYFPTPPFDDTTLYYYGLKYTVEEDSYYCTYAGGNIIPKYLFEINFTSTEWRDIMSPYLNSSGWGQIDDYVWCYPLDTREME